MNFTQTKFYKPLLVFMSILLLCGVSRVQAWLNQDRAALGLTRITPLENAPPVLAFTTVALGGFRGLIANILWIRANDLQEEDKYFEMMQLASWITKLEPHFVQVWTVQAWNMAYNISVKFKEPQDRWRWVRRGLELLRDDGLRYNPDEPLIYRELAWFFQHKMGYFLDDAQMYYKVQWYQEMNYLFGGPADFKKLLNPKDEEERLRVNVLRDRYKMDPVLMKEIDDHYGPLEWRLPDAHAIYWAVKALKKAKREDLMQVRRVIYQSMQEVFMRGALVEHPLTGDFMLRPNLDAIKNVDAAYHEMMDQEPAQAEHIGIGHKNFLKNAVYFLYTNNRLAEAETWFKTVKKLYPGAISQDPAVEKKMTLEEYAFQQVTEEVKDTNVDKTRSLLIGLYTSAFVDLALDEDERADRYQRMARAVRARFDKETKGEAAKRLLLESDSDLKKMAFEHIVSAPRKMPAEAMARLRTKLNLPAAPASTNAPAGRTNTPPRLLTPLK